jgi:ATPase subunit of ABC transporter with duplicated ATPase domains
VVLGGSVKMGYFDFAQHAMDLLDGDETVFQSLETSFPQAGQGALRTLAETFWCWTSPPTIWTWRPRRC